ncbi:UNVERIFIED_ORG: sensor histidine kinase [Bacillus sp. AZ43]
MVGQVTGTSSRSGARPAAALLALAVVAALGGLTAVLLLPTARAGSGADRVTVVLFLAGMTLLAVVGWVVTRRRPDQARVGLLLATVGALGAVGRAVIGLALALPDPAPAPLAWATNWIWIPGTAAVLVLLLRFPTGTLPAAGWRWAERLALGWGAVAIGVTALVPGPLAVTPLDRDNPVGVAAADWLEATLAPLFAVLPLLVLTATAALVVRYRGAAAEERQQLRWVVAAVGLLALASPLATLGDDGAALLEGAAYLVLPAAVVVAVLRHRLWDLGLVVRRGVAYAVASGALLAAYVLTVTATQDLLRGRVPDALATAVVAVLAVPVLTAVQRGLERLLYGDRREPDRVVAQLAERLAATPEALLPQVAEQVATSLRLPYVAVQLPDGTPAAAAGAPTGTELRLPLRHGGRTVGWLLAGRRTPAEPLDGHSRQLLERVAAHAGLAVHSALLTAELQQATDRLRVARVEERARLRGDLHDELGPALGAISLRAEAARNLLATGDVARIDAVLSGIEQAAEAAVGEVRRILADLQPRVLEEDGLHAALRQVAAGVPEDVRVELDLPAPVALPPRVELAAYRVAAEALRNAVRHAAADVVRLAVRTEGDALELVVADDGVGLAPGAVPGVGLESMRQRARELGGTLDLASGAGRGTTVRLRLPLEAA